MIRALVLAFAVVACPVGAGAQSVASIFTGLPSDFKHMGDPSNLLILGGTGAASAIVHPKDQEIALRTNDPDQFFSAGDAFGNAAYHVIAGAAFYVGGRVAHNTKYGQLGVDLLQGQFVSGVITDGIKLATNRTRPDGRAYSFPSGHTSSAFASAAVLQRHFGWKVGIPSYVIASYVASSRVANYHHYASDVIFGAGIGMAAGRATTFHYRGQQISVTPTATRDSAALNVSITR